MVVLVVRMVAATSLSDSSQDPVGYQCAAVKDGAVAGAEEKLTPEGASRLLF